MLVQSFINMSCNEMIVSPLPDIIFHNDNNIIGSLGYDKPYPTLCNIVCTMHVYDVICQTLSV